MSRSPMAFGQSTSGSASRAAHARVAPTACSALWAASRPSTAAGSICATFKKRRDDGEYGLNLVGAALNIACVGLMASACAPRRALSIANAASAALSALDEVD